MLVDKNASNKNVGMQQSREKHTPPDTAAIVTGAYRTIIVL
jgi:hypothetical protein